MFSEACVSHSVYRGGGGRVSLVPCLIRGSRVSWG